MTGLRFWIAVKYLISPLHSGPVAFSIEFPSHRYPILAPSLRGPPVILDRRPATEHGPVIIDDAEPARRELRTESLQHLNRGLIQIAVEPKDSDLVNRRGRHGVFEPAFDQPYLVAPEAHSPEVFDHRFDAYCQLWSAGAVPRVLVQNAYMPRALDTTIAPEFSPNPSTK